MRIIAVTTPKVIAQDADIITSLLRRGVDIIHLRKPDSNVDECRALLRDLDNESRARIIVHDYPELYYEFSLKGIHVNRSVTRLPDGYAGFKSCSCHTFDEVVRYKSDYDYLFISPIFDSIS
jgi:thiamine-phosphate pyrophosphorylase